jgi:radical SAM superfamily enzyme YgiQ (UPF0313 family)
MRIVLLSPKGPLYRHRGGIFGKGLRYMPLTLPTLAALIPVELPHTLACYDEGIAELPEDLKADLVGITVITGTAPRAYDIASKLRARGVTVVMGGPHPTLIPEDVQPHADAIVVGYAEDEWPRLLHDFAAGRLKPRYVARPDVVIGGRPLPDRSVLPARRYITKDVFEATRGCVHKCDFCVVPSAWPGRPLQKPPEEIVSDIRRSRSRRALFVDLNIIADRAYALRLFSALEPLHIHWFGLATTLLGEDEELLDAAARSGCRGLLMGLESIEVAGLKGMHKGFNDPQRYPQLVERLHQRRIALQGCFVFGGDQDRPDIFLRTARFAVDIGIDLPRFAILTPFPGTPLHRRLTAEQRILHRNWEKYDGQHVVFRPAHMTQDELQCGTEAAWRHAYSWSALARRLRTTAAPLHVALVTNLGYRFYARRLHRFYTCDAMSWDSGAEAVA